MSGRRQSATTQRAAQTTGADQGQTQSFLPAEIVEHLHEGGWERVTEHPNAHASTADSFKHPQKSGGNPLPAKQAYESELRARAAQANEDAADGSGSSADAELADLKARLAEAESALEESKRAEAAALLAKLEPTMATPVSDADDESIIHNQVGLVSFWHCYRCDFSCRYSPGCDCPVCAEITRGVACPKCGDDNPNLAAR